MDWELKNTRENKVLLTFKTSKFIVIDFDISICKILRWFVKNFSQESTRLCYIWEFATPIVKNLRAMMTFDWLYLYRLNKYIVLKILQLSYFMQDWILIQQFHCFVSNSNDIK